MFTLKFVNKFDSGSTVEVVTCPHYEKYSRNSGHVTVAVYKDFTKTDGVEYTIIGDRSAANDDHADGKFYHEHCYIENSAGKTIDHF
jgi:hypothetical protein